MNRRNGLMVAVLAWMCCGLGNAQEANQTLEHSDLGELRGKIVALTLMSDSVDLVLLSQVAQRRIGGKTFLIGEGVDDGETPDWRNGAAVYVPMDDIQQIVAFANLAAYRKNLDARLDRGDAKAASSRRAGRRI